MHLGHELCMFSWKGVDFSISQLLNCLVQCKGSLIACAVCNAIAYWMLWMSSYNDARILMAVKMGYLLERTVVCGKGAYFTSFTQRLVSVSEPFVRGYVRSALPGCTYPYSIANAEDETLCNIKTHTHTHMYNDNLYAACCMSGRYIGNIWQNWQMPIKTCTIKQITVSTLKYMMIVV